MYAKIHTQLRDLKAQLEGHRLIHMGTTNPRISTGMRFTSEPCHLEKAFGQSLAFALTYVLRAEQAFLSGRYKRAQSHLNKAWMQFYQNHLNTDLIKPALDISDDLEKLHQKQRASKAASAKEQLDSFFHTNFGIDCDSDKPVQHSARLDSRVHINVPASFNYCLNVPRIIAAKVESINPFAVTPFSEALQKAVQDSLKEAMGPADANQPLTDQQVKECSAQYPGTDLGRACTELAKNRKLIAELQKLLRGFSAY